MDEKTKRMTDKLNRLMQKGWSPSATRFSSEEEMDAGLKELEDLAGREKSEDREKKAQDAFDVVMPVATTALGGLLGNAPGAMLGATLGGAWVANRNGAFDSKPGAPEVKLDPPKNNIGDTGSNAAGNVQSVGQAGGRLKALGNLTGITGGSKGDAPEKTAAGEQVFEYVPSMRETFTNKVLPKLWPTGQFGEALSVGQVARGVGGKALALAAPITGTVSGAAGGGLGAWEGTAGQPLARRVGATAGGVLRGGGEGLYATTVEPVVDFAAGVKDQLFPNTPAQKGAPPARTPQPKPSEPLPAPPIAMARAPGSRGEEKKDESADPKKEKKPEMDKKEKDAMVAKLAWRGLAGAGLGAVGGYAAGELLDVDPALLALLGAGIGGGVGLANTPAKVKKLPRAKVTRNPAQAAIESRAQANAAAPSIEAVRQARIPAAVAPTQPAKPTLAQVADDIAGRKRHGLDGVFAPLPDEAPAVVPNILNNPAAWASGLTHLAASRGSTKLALDMNHPVIGPALRRKLREAALA